MTIQILMTLSVIVVVPTMPHLGLATCHVLVERFVVSFAVVRPSGLVKDSPVASDATPVAKLMPKCLSCKDDRGAKKPPLPPMDVIKLPAIATSSGFKKPEIPTIVCPWCDGETLVTSAIRNCDNRQKPQA